MPKCKYDTHVAPFLEEITQWAEKGASQAEIADRLNLAQSTFKLYLSKGDKGEEPFSDLSACFRRACEVPNDEVEAALYKNCVGYNAKVAKNFKLKEVIYDEETGKKIKEFERLVTAFDEVHIPANTTAQMFWLTNRRADRWRYKPAEVEGNESETGVVMIPEVAAIE